MLSPMRGALILAAATFLTAGSTAAQTPASPASDGVQAGSQPTTTPMTMPITMNGSKTHSGRRHRGPTAANPNLAATLPPTGTASAGGVVSGSAPNAGVQTTRAPASVIPPIGSGGATGQTTISGRPPG